MDAGTPPEGRRRVNEYANRSLPIVSLMDTPGAAGDEVANKGNQSHSISRLIAEMSNTDVPILGIVYGLGYSAARFHWRRAT